MATRQYIGARYVPKFYQNSVDGSTQWEANVVYEPLIYVTLQNGHMYISKKQVPATVGTPAQNIDYWLDIGDYNGYISELSERIDGVQDEIDILNTDISKAEIKQSARKYVLIFDSYGAVGGNSSLASIVETACTGGYHTLQVGGAGFIGATGGTTWGQSFESWVSTLTSDEKASYTDIMIFGGINDYAYTPTDLTLAIEAFQTLVNTHMPQCHVTLAPISWSIRNDSSMSDYENNVYYGYSLGASKVNWKYVSGLNAYIHNDIFMESNDVHPTADGARQMARAIKDFIITGVIPKLTTAPLEATFTPTALSVSSSHIYTQICEDSVAVNGALVLSNVTPVTVQSGYTTALNLGSLSRSYFRGKIMSNLPFKSITVPAYIHDTTAGWVLKPVNLQFYVGYVFLCVEGGTFTFDAIQTTPFSFTCPLNCC